MGVFSVSQDVLDCGTCPRCLQRLAFALLTNVLMDTDGCGTPVAYNVYGQGLISRILADDSLLTYHYDSRGSTIAMTDAAEDILRQFAYDAFGRTVAHSGSADQPYRYLGKHGIQDEGNQLQLYPRPILRCRSAAFHE